MVDVRGGQSGPIQSPLECRPGQGGQGLLAEPVLPLTATRLARDSPPFEELIGGGRVTEQLGDSAVGGEHERHGPVAALALVGAPGQPGAKIGQHGERGGPFAGQRRQLDGGPARAD